MTAIVLRISGENVAPDAHTPWMAMGLVDQVWRRGDMRIGGRVVTTSGFSLCLADDDVSANAGVERALGILRAHREALLKLVDAGATAVVDVALYVPGYAPRSVTFPTSFVEAVVDCGASLEVSAYPCHDDN